MCGPSLLPAFARRVPLKGQIITDAMNGGKALDDRFDSRELLLHLGDILEAWNCLARTNRQDAPVKQIAQEEDSLQDFEFFRALAPKMNAAEFSAHFVSAFRLWPKGLLEAELNLMGPGVDSSARPV